MLQHEQSSSRSLTSFLMHPASTSPPVLLPGQQQQPSVGQGGRPGGTRLGSVLWSGSHLFPGGWVLAPWWQALLGMCSPAGYSGWLGASLSWSALALRGFSKGRGPRPARGTRLWKKVRMATGLQRSPAAGPAVGTGDQVVLLLLSSLA